MKTFFKYTLTSIYIWIGMFSSLEAGPKGLGMGNVGTVYPVDDATVGVNNPACMAVCPNRWDVGAGIYNHSGHVDVHDNEFPLIEGAPYFNGSFNAVSCKNWPIGTFGINKHFCVA